VRLRRLGPTPWHGHAALAPSFAKRIDLRGTIRRERTYPIVAISQDARELRYRMLQPGQSILGALWAEKAAAAGLDVRDPTLDDRVLRFCLSVPDHLYKGSDPKDDRWLIRSAMAGLLPDCVRLNQRRGRQSADILPRLRQDSAAMDQALAQIMRSKAVEYLDMPRLQATWQRAQVEDSNTMRMQASVVLLRGLMAGLFLEAKIGTT